MNDVKTILEILIDALRQKRDCLRQLEDLTKEQAEILDGKSFEVKAFQRTINNKQVWIDKVLMIDKGFNAQFEKVSGRLENSPKLYADEINILKQLITEVGELGIAIEVLEKRNKPQFELVSKGLKEKVKTFKKSKKVATNYYSTMNKKAADKGSYFFDSKK